MKTVFAAVFAIALTGCANSFDKVRTAAAGAPDWYDAAREEIIGAGYPDLANTPQLSEEQVETSASALKMSREDIAAAREMFATDPRSTEPVTTETEMRAYREYLVARLASSGPTPTGTDADLFLTKEDLDRFRAKFKRAEQQ